MFFVYLINDLILFGSSRYLIHDSGILSLWKPNRLLLVSCWCFVMSKVFNQDAGGLVTLIRFVGHVLYTR